MSDVTVVSILQRQAEDLRDRAETSRKRAKDLTEMAAENAADAHEMKIKAAKQEDAAARIENLVREMGGQQ